MGRVMGSGFWSVRATMCTAFKNIGCAAKIAFLRHQRGRSSSYCRLSFFDTEWTEWTIDIASVGCTSKILLVIVINVAMAVVGVGTVK